ncbi:MAG: redoxin domain-containing protein [Cryobacterium sp.]|nr:redoxin domain-containing protein [Cryobacterium sp.]
MNDKLQEFEAAGIKVAAVSADPREKAETEVKEEGWRFPVAYDMSLEQMRELGLYISDPRSPQETDRPFAEPATFAINPDGNVQVVDISNAPFSRPDLASLLSGLKFIQEKQYPVRGTKT